jgi:hypothetical protein
MVSLDIVIAITAIVSAIAAITAVIVGIMNLRTINKAQEPQFELNRMINSPVGTSMQTIEVSHPDKPIKNCTVLYDGKPLVCINNIDPKQYEKTILAGGVSQFRLPAKAASELDENVLIIVKDGKKTLQSIKLKDIRRA